MTTTIQARGLSASQVARVRATWEQVVPMADEAVQLFYERLFELEPALRALFPRGDMPAQRRKLLGALAFAVEHLDRPDALAATLAALGARHVGYGVKPGHYALVGEALLWTLEQVLGAAMDDEARHAWAMAYAGVAAGMRRGEGR